VRQSVKKSNKKTGNAPKKKLHYTKLWKRIVLGSLIFMMASIAGEFFFHEYLTAHGWLEPIQLADVPVSLILLSDIALHFQDAKDKKRFLATHALEIIAVLPIAGVLIMFRSLRFVPLMAEIPLIAELTAADKIIKMEKSFRLLEGFRELLRF
jgi:hypothetical protein